MLYYLVWGHTWTHTDVVLICQFLCTAAPMRWFVPAPFWCCLLSLLWPPHCCALEHDPSGTLLSWAGGLAAPRLDTTQGRKEGRQMGAIALWELLFGRITIYFYFHNAHLTCASIMSFVTKADWCCWLSNENSLKILQDTELVFPHSSLSTTLVSAVIVRLKYVHFCYFVLVDTNVFLHWLAQPGWGSSLFLFCLWGDGILYHTVVIAPEILSSHFFSSDFYSATLCLHRNWFKCLTPILLWMKWMFLDYIAMMLAGMELGLMDPLTELEITRIKV